MALGIDLRGLALAAALGEPAEVPVAEHVGGACVRFLVPPEGVLRAVEGLDEAAAVDGVLDVGIYREPGVDVPALPERLRPGRLPVRPGGVSGRRPGAGRPCGPAHTL